MTARDISRGARFEALDEIILLVPLDPRYNQVGFNRFYVQVCMVQEGQQCTLSPEGIKLLASIKVNIFSTYFEM